MDELIKQMVDKGLVSFVSRGTASAVFTFIKVMAETRPLDYREIKVGVN
jgi:hypothetical protein